MCVCVREREREREREKIILNDFDFVFRWPQLSKQFLSNHFLLTKLFFINKIKYVLINVYFILNTYKTYLCMFIFLKHLSCPFCTYVAFDQIIIELKLENEDNELTKMNL